MLPIDPEANFVLFGLGGQAQQDWQPMQVEAIQEDDRGRARDISDFPWCGGHVLMARRRALNAFRPLLERYGEMLSLRCGEPDGVRVSSIYFQETVVRRIGELGLKGAGFKLVWSDEPVPENEMRIEYPGERRPVPTRGALKTFLSGFFGR